MAVLTDEQLAEIEARAKRLRLFWPEQAVKDIASLVAEVRELRTDMKAQGHAHEMAVDGKGRAHERIARLEGHLRGMLKFEKLDHGARERIIKILETSCHD